MKANTYVYLLTALAIVGDVVVFLVNKTVPDILTLTTVTLVGGSVGITVPANVSESAPTVTK